LSLDPTGGTFDLSNKKIIKFSTGDVTITNISQSLPHTMAGNTELNGQANSWHGPRYGMKKLSLCIYNAIKVIANILNNKK